MDICREHGKYWTFCKHCVFNKEINELLKKSKMPNTSDFKKYIVYDEGSKPYPDEVTHITQHQIHNELVAKIQEKLGTMSLDDLLVMAKQVNIVVEEIG